VIILGDCLLKIIKNYWNFVNIIRFKNIFSLSDLVQRVNSVDPKMQNHNGATIVGHCQKMILNQEFHILALR
mgnify:CR=1